MGVDDAFNKYGHAAESACHQASQPDIIVDCGDPQPAFQGVWEIEFSGDDDRQVDTTKLMKQCISQGSYIS